jgi:hypothetical protein
VSLRVYGIEDCTLADVLRGGYAKQKHTNLNLEGAHDLGVLLDESKVALDAANARRLLVTDKCKTLLTLSSFLVTAVGLLLPKSFDFGVLWMRIVCLVAVLLLLHAIVLLLVYLGVGWEQVTCVTQADVELSPDDLKKSLINEHLGCQVATDNRTDYLADIYKVARACFLCAFFLIVILFAANYFRNKDPVDDKRLIRELRSDPELLNLLKGPKGDSGAAGPKGERGPKGAPGPKGDPAPHGEATSRQANTTSITPPAATQPGHRP